jgi:hypothetical protein
VELPPYTISIHLFLLSKMRFKHIFSLSLLSTLFLLFACSEATEETKMVEYTLPEGTTEVASVAVTKWDAVADGKHRGAKITFADMPAPAQDYLLKNADTSAVKAYLKLTAKDSTNFYLVKFTERSTAPLAFDAAGALISRPAVGVGRPRGPRDSSHVHDSTHVHGPRDSSHVHDSTHVRGPRGPRDSSHVHTPRDTSGTRGGRGRGGRG